MTLKDLYLLENVSITENTYYVYISADDDYHLKVDNKPFDDTIVKSVEFLKQDEYTKVEVIKDSSIFDTSTNFKIYK